MTKVQSRLLALLLCLTGPACALQAIAASNVNLRAGPATTAQLLQVIPKAPTLTVGACTTWCAVRFGGQSGYVARSTLSFKSSPPPVVPIRMPASSGTYTNVDGQQSQRPVMSDSAPAGASARCRDGSYSFSTHRSGTCSHHGGVGEWL